MEYPLAQVDFGDGVLRKVDISALDDVKPGDVVIIHAGIAIEKMKENELNRMIESIQELIGELESRDPEEILREILGVKL